MVLKKTAAGLLSLAMLGAGAFCELPENVTGTISAQASSISSSTSNYTFGTKKTIKGYGTKNYNLKLSSSGRLDFTLNKTSSYMLKIYDSKGNKAASLYTNSSYHYVNLKAGNYTIEATNGSSDTFGFTAKFTSAKETFKETGKNDKKSGADKISFNKLYKGQLASNDQTDYYKVSVNNESGMLLSLTSKAEKNPVVTVYNSKGTRVYATDYSSYTNHKLNARIKVSKGTYYIRVENLFSVLNEYTGNYALKLTSYNSKQVISNVKSSYTVNPEMSLTIDPKAKEKAKISYKSSNTSICTVTDYGYIIAKKAGKAVITITAESTTGYRKGSKKVVVYCTPKCVSGLNGYTKEKGTATVKWSKSSDASGYVIKYARNSKMKNAAKKTIKGNSTTSYRLTGLKSGQKYWITIYAYKTIDGKNYYSTDPYVSIVGTIH